MCIRDSITINVSSPNTPGLRDLIRLGRVLVDLYCASYAVPPKAVTLDIDGMAKVTGTTRNGLSLLARDAIELLASADLAKMRECSNPDCTRLFVDVSRGGSRRWCGMAECGNRKKAADYRRRHKELST